MGIIASRYLSDRLSRVADISSQSRLRSPTSSQLTVRRSRLVTAGERSFAFAGRKLRNSLPVDITPASSLTAFRRKPKHIYFGSHIRTLLGSLFVVVLAMLILALRPAGK